MSIPKYISIKNELIGKIKELSPNAPVLSERVLAEEYDASRMTVRRAVDELVDEGYLYRDSNKGTFVADVVHHKRNTTIEESNKAEELNYKILYFDVKGWATKEVQENLGVQPDEWVVRMVRLSLIEKRPVTIEEIYIKRLNMSDEELRNMPNWRNFNRYMEQGGSLTQRFVPTLVPMQYAHFLGMKINEPIILVENFVNLKNGKPLIYMKTYNNPREKIIEITQ